MLDLRPLNSIAELSPGDTVRHIDGGADHVVTSVSARKAIATPFVELTDPSQWLHLPAGPSPAQEEPEALKPLCQGCGWVECACDDPDSAPAPEAPPEVPEGRWEPIDTPYRGTWRQRVPLAEAPPEGEQGREDGEPPSAAHVISKSRAGGGRDEGAHHYAVLPRRETRAEAMADLARWEALAVAPPEGEPFRVEWDGAVHAVVAWTGERVWTFAHPGVAGSVRDLLNRLFAAYRSTGAAEAPTEASLGRYEVRWADDWEVFDRQVGARVAVCDFQTLAHQIAAALNRKDAEPPAAPPAPNDNELPGMWSNADLAGGWTDAEAAPPAPEGEAPSAAWGALLTQANLASTQLRACTCDPGAPLTAKRIDYALSEVDPFHPPARQEAGGLREAAEHYDASQPSRFSLAEVEAAVGRHATLPLTGVIVAADHGPSGPWVDLQIDERWGLPAGTTFRFDLDAMQLDPPAALDAAPPSEPPSEVLEIDEDGAVHGDPRVVEGLRPAPPVAAPGEKQAEPRRDLSLLRNVVSCARCGGDHPQLWFSRLKKPAASSDRLYTLWATCPETGQPILAADSPLSAAPPPAMSEEGEWQRAAIQARDDLKALLREWKINLAEWSSPANTLRWIDKLEAAALERKAGQPEGGEVRP